MNRKLVNGLLLLTLASGGCGMFTSCKDTDEDWKNQVIVGQVSLEDQIQALWDAIHNIKQCDCDYQTAINNLRTELEGKINTLNQALADKADKTVVDGILADIQTINIAIAKLEADYGNLQNQVNTISTGLTNVENKLSSLDGRVSTLEGEMAVIRQIVDGFTTVLNTQLGQLNTTLASIEATLGTEIPAIKTSIEALNTTLTQTNQKLDALNLKVNEIEYDLWRMANQLEANGALIAALEQRYNELSGRLDTLASEFESFKESYNEYKENTLEPALASLRDLDTLVNGKGGLVDQIMVLESRVTALEGDNEQNKEDINNLYDAIEGMRTQISNVNARVNMLFSALNDRLNSLITDLILNQTWNPMFGTINLPIGLSTTIAANYYGYTNHDVKFPIQTGTWEYNADLSDLTVLLNEDMEALTNLQSTIKKSSYFGDSQLVDLKDGDYYISSADNNLGQLYLTINPNNINFDGQKVKLVNTKDEEAPLDITVKKCNDEELTFGANISRAATDNGFYRANVKLEAADAPKIGIRVEEGLKSAMKDALLDHTKQDFVSLAKLLYKQMEGVLPAYAVKATWKAPVVVNKEVEVVGEDGEMTTQIQQVTEDQEFAVYSKYDIAATAMRPLGYMFMYDVNLTEHKIKLPTYEGSIREILDDFFKDFKINFNLGLTGITDVNFKDFSINLEGVDLDFGQMEIEIDLNGTNLQTTQWNEYTEQWEEVVIKIGGPKGSAEWSAENVITLEYTPSGVVGVPGTGALAGFVDQISEQINNLLKGDDGLAAKINEQIKTQLISQVDKMIEQVNSQLQGVNGKIDSEFERVINDIKNKLMGKLGRLDSLVDKYNALARRINGILSDPNHYLQIMAAYEDGNGSLHHLSTSKGIPSTFVKGSGNALELFVTSYTAELIAPSYAKYVAVSRVLDKQGNKVSNSDALVNTINSNNEFLNVALRGNQQRVVIDADDLSSDYIYEVVYSSLDYRGYTSSRLYYFQIAK